MPNVKRVSKKVGFTIIFFMLLVGAAFAVVCLFRRHKADTGDRTDSAEQCRIRPPPKLLWNLVLEYYPKFWYTIFPAVMIFSLVVGLFAWLMARSSIKKLAVPSEEIVEETDAGR